MKHLVAFLLALVCCISFAGLAESGDNATLTEVPLATSEWSPYTSQKMDGYGFYTQIVSAVFEEMGLTPKYSFYPWKRCEGTAEAGKIWAIFPYTSTRERAEVFDFSDTIAYSTTKFFYYGPDKGYAYDTLEDLKKYKVGGVSGYFYTESFADAGIDVSYAPDEKSAFKMLRMGRTDILALNNMVGWHIIRMNFPDEADKFHTLDKPLSNNPLRLMVSRSYPGSKELLEQFNSALQTVTHSMTIQHILEEHGLKN